jgi:hypothetical protein
MSFVPDISEYENDPYIIGRRYGRLFRSAECYLEQHLRHTESKEFKDAVGYNEPMNKKYCWALIHAKRSAIEAAKRVRCKHDRMVQKWRDLMFFNMVGCCETIEREIKNLEELIGEY